MINGTIHIPNLPHQNLDVIAQDAIGKDGDTNNRCHTFNVLWVSVCIEGNAAEFISEQEIIFQKGMILLSDVT